MQLCCYAAKGSSMDQFYLALRLLLVALQLAQTLQNLWQRYRDWRKSRPH